MNLEPTRKEIEKMDTNEILGILLILRDSKEGLGLTPTADMMVTVLLRQQDEISNLKNYIESLKQQSALGLFL